MVIEYFRELYLGRKKFVCKVVRGGLVRLSGLVVSIEGVFLVLFFGGGGFV